MVLEFAEPSPDVGHRHGRAVSEAVTKQDGDAHADASTFQDMFARRFATVQEALAEHHGCALRWLAAQKEGEMRMRSEIEALQQQLNKLKPGSGEGAAPKAGASSSSEKAVQGKALGFADAGPEQPRDEMLPSDAPDGEQAAAALSDCGDSQSKIAATSTDQVSPPVAGCEGNAPLPGPNTKSWTDSGETPKLCVRGSRASPDILESTRSEVAAVWAAPVPGGHPDRALTPKSSKAAWAGTDPDGKQSKAMRTRQQSDQTTVEEYKEEGSGVRLKTDRLEQKRSGSPASMESLVQEAPTMFGIVPHEDLAPAVAFASAQQLEYCGNPDLDDEKEISRRGSGSAVHATGTAQMELRSIQAPKAVFADAQAMKEKLRNAMSKPQYDVSDYYKRHGIWQFIARDHYFDHLTLTIIGINALWIAIDTDHNRTSSLLEAEALFQVAENAFCFYFTFEWLVRFLSFQHKLNGFRDRWFCFDSCLVSTMILETWLLPLIIIATGAGGGGALGNASMLRLLRLLRLSRMARMARLLRAMPELMVMIKGMAVAMRSVFFTLCLLGCIIYVFAIAFVQQLRGTVFDGSGRDPFESVPEAMKRLLLDGVLPDQGPFVEMVGSQGPFAWLAVMVYILLGSLTVMNMLVGVLCEVVSVVSSVEKESLLITFVRNQLLTMIKESGLDSDGDNRISRQEFESLLEKEAAAKCLQMVGVDVVGLVDFTDFIFEGDKMLTFPDFMDVVLQLRGSNVATVKDIVDLRKMFMAEFDKYRLEMEELTLMADKAVKPPDCAPKPRRTMRFF
eukprot:TRINITY_DN5720_c1_g1_i1.p1 TRINITY_DN5720_c1_g1~~TRINITY_DN5720_c1_g1_i1.p1  ORF type:complete len:790 (+),score=197.57 TRINITY_DN5720_c1_g1_i1:114-2483(+)